MGGGVSGRGWGGGREFLCVVVGCWLWVWVCGCGWVGGGGRVAIDEEGCVMGGLERGV